MDQIGVHPTSKRGKKVELSCDCGGRIVNETGLETFSIHRLRHTLASNLASGGADVTTMMTCLGWVSPSSIDGVHPAQRGGKGARLCHCHGSGRARACSRFR